MDIIKFCQECQTHKIVGQKCDTCGIATDKEAVPIRIEFTYGSELDGETYDFCCLEHLQEFILNEIKKGN